MLIRLNDDEGDKTINKDFLLVNFKIGNKIIPSKMINGRFQSNATSESERRRIYLLLLLLISALLLMFITRARKFWFGLKPSLVLLGVQEDTLMKVINNRLLVQTAILINISRMIQLGMSMTNFERAWNSGTSTK